MAKHNTAINNYIFADLLDRFQAFALTLSSVVNFYQKTYGVENRICSDNYNHSVAINALTLCIYRSWLMNGHGIDYVG